MTDLEKAKSVVVDLMREHQKTIEHWENLSAERSAISYAASAEGDEKAKRRSERFVEMGHKRAAVMTTELEMKRQQIAARGRRPQRVGPQGARRSPRAHRRPRRPRQHVGRRAQLDPAREGRLIPITPEGTRR